MKWKKGQILKSECISCCKEEEWEIESITKEEYSDGFFKTYNLKAIKHCFADGIRTSIKDVPNATMNYNLINKKV